MGSDFSRKLDGERSTASRRRLQPDQPGDRANGHRRVMSVYSPNIVSFDIDGPLRCAGVDNKHRAWEGSSLHNRARSATFTPTALAHDAGHQTRSACSRHRRSSGSLRTLRAPRQGEQISSIEEFRHMRRSPPTAARAQALLRHIFDAHVTDPRPHSLHRIAFPAPPQRILHARDRGVDGQPAVGPRQSPELAANHGHDWDRVGCGEHSAIQAI